MIHTRGAGRGGALTVGVLLLPLRLAVVVVVQLRRVQREGPPSSDDSALLAECAAANTRHPTHNTLTVTTCGARGCIREGGREGRDSQVWRAIVFGETEEPLAAVHSHLLEFRVVATAAEWV
jgi:hypothetical protein